MVDCPDQLDLGHSRCSRSLVGDARAATALVWRYRFRVWHERARTGRWRRRRRFRQYIWCAGGGHLASESAGTTAVAAATTRLGPLAASSAGASSATPLGEEQWRRCCEQLSWRSRRRRGEGVARFPHSRVPWLAGAEARDLGEVAAWNVASASSVQVAQYTGGAEVSGSARGRSRRRSNLQALTVFRCIHRW